MKLDCTNCSPEECYINKYCTSQSIRVMAQSKSAMRYKKNQYIFREGNPVHGIYIIHSGKVKVLSTGFNEKAQIIRIAKSGYLLGHRGFGDKFYQISAVAIEDSTICFIEAGIFTKLLKSDPELTYQLMLFYANELRLAESRMKNLAQMTVKEKSAESLLLLKQIFGVRKKIGVVLDTVLARKDMAELAGLSPEQLIKCFSEFRDERAIRIDGKTITILQPEILFKLIAPYYPNQNLREIQHAESFLV